MLELFFFGAKLRRMRFSAAAHEPHGMFLVQHLVIEDVGHYVCRYAGPVELAVDHNEIQRGIEAAKLCTPGAPAPCQSGLRERIIKIAVVQLME